MVDTVIAILLATLLTFIGFSFYDKEQDKKYRPTTNETAICNSKYTPQTTRIEVKASSLEKQALEIAKANTEANLTWVKDKTNEAAIQQEMERQLLVKLGVCK